MNSIRATGAYALDFFKVSSKTTHGRILLCGFGVGLVYLYNWLKSIFVFTFISGAIFQLVAVGAIGLGGTQLWRERKKIKHLVATHTARKWGHFLIFLGIGLFPFCLGRMWSQALIWTLIWGSMTFSNWGWKFFERYWSSIGLILIGIYPSFLLSLFKYLWKLATPPEAFEQITAWVSGSILKLLGFPVVFHDVHIFLPTGGVKVYESCTGFEMVISITFLSILIGVGFQMRWISILLLSSMAPLLAMGMNFLRVVLMTLAAAYWDDSVFEFLHGVWGGQVFAGTLFTIYYYLIVWMLSIKSPLKQPQAKRNLGVVP